MKYIRKNGNVLEKYDVIFDKKELENLMIKITQKCGERHNVVENDSYRVPGNGYSNYDCDEYNENISYNVSKNRGTEYKDYEEYEVPLYNYKCTKYICPKIVLFIKKVIYGSTDVLTDLFNKDYSKIVHFKTVEEKIRELINELNKCGSDVIEKRKNKLEELNNNISKLNNEKLDVNNYKKLQKGLNELTTDLSKIEKENNKKIEEINKELSYMLEIRELNKNQEIDISYIEELDGLIEFKLIDTLDISNIERINSFFSEEIVKQKDVLVLKWR